MDKYVVVTLKKMFEAVGQKYSPESVEGHDWYLAYDWTLEQQTGFEVWLTNYLYKNTKARKSICHIPRKDMKHLKKVAKMFTFQHGWRLKDE